jgi:uncharacterized membrane protein
MHHAQAGKKDLILDRDSRFNDNPVFAARLTPYRSLGPKGFKILMAFVAASCLISGLLFLAIGAWPVFGFFGLDAFLIWLAFRLNYRSGRMAEEVEIWQHELRLRKIAASGKVVTHVLNPFWTRFVVDRHDEFGITRMTLQSRERLIDIGSFLNPLDRESFADAFSHALSRVKSG